MSLFSFSDLLLFVGKKIESKRLFSIKALLDILFFAKNFLKIFIFIDFSRKLPKCLVK
ncbi:hypothetical protein CU011_0623 [Enterococcus faecium]|nr:Hypothetical protein EfmE4452_2069 [Enterococcus faecium E4452]EHM34184.1 Hypothetical protein EfmE4453_1646 [Enterococcus faecium E4453]EJX73312.1 hypothetical protein HMPREF1371_01573 [Enterococcus faecium P1137]EJY22783.1 hypothetical protein HMPREF1357_00870 [Enterococcus faecium C497]EJY47326.1 hypothetical protein HMPREF1349_01229 [Enterococcus faecium 506]EPI11399.1 hypothetical protein D357_00972 [Enterococcus faecium SD3B-2]EPI17921.1 hypothetical protein D355_00619 [Enterococcus 